MEASYANFYRCECGEEWSDVWSCMCNDRCPACGTKDIEPYRSVDIEDTDAEMEDKMQYGTGKSGIVITDEYIQKVIKKINDGDGLTNKELLIAINFYRESERCLRLLGPDYKMIRNTVNRDLDVLMSFAHARTHDGSTFNFNI